MYLIGIVDNLCNLFVTLALSEWNHEHQLKFENTGNNFLQKNCFSSSQNDSELEDKGTSGASENKKRI